MLNINQEPCSCSVTSEALLACPNCDSKGNKVKSETLKKHLNKDIYTTIKSSKDSFNFCTSPTCNTVYYSNERNETFSQEMVKHKIAAKNKDLDTPLCYCKRFTKQNAIDVIESGDKDVTGTILDAIGDNCKCSKTNPKGVSCVEDITNFLAPYGIEFNTSKKSSSSCDSNKDDDLAIRFMKSVLKGNGMNEVTFTKEKNSCC